MGKQHYSGYSTKDHLVLSIVQQLYTQLLRHTKPEDAAQGSGLLFTESPWNDLEV